MWPLIILCTAVASALWADELAPCCPPPFSLEGSYESICSASLRGHPKRDAFQYNHKQIRFSYIESINKSDGVIFGAGFDQVNVNWKANPFFTETNFNYANLAIGFFTAGFEEFVWSLSLTAYFDTQVLDLTDFTLYETVLIGKYNITKDLLFHVGLIGRFGLDDRQVWPVFGFEFDQGGCIRIGAVYPIDLAIEYRLLPDWLSLALSARFFEARHRVKNSVPVPREIFHYRNWGIEGSLIGFPLSGFVVIGFVGSTLNGQFKVSDDKNDVSNHFRLGNALYSGVEANWTF